MREIYKVGIWHLLWLWYEDFEEFQWTAGGAVGHLNNVEVHWKGAKYNANVTYCSYYNCFLYYGYLKEKGMIYVRWKAWWHLEMS